MVAVAVAVVVVVVVIVVAAAAVVVIMCGVRINACSFFSFYFQYLDTLPTGPTPNKSQT